MWDLFLDGKYGGRSEEICVLERVCLGGELWLGLRLNGFCAMGY